MYEQNDNEGRANINLNGAQGFGFFSPGIDIAPGYASIQSGYTSGYLISASILPNSFSAWGTIQVTANIQNYSDLSIDILDCTGNEINGFTGLTLQGGNNINISAIDAASISCIKAKIVLNKNGSIPPRLTNFKVTRTPLPVFLATIAGPSIHAASKDVNYSINYSLSYVNEENTVIYLQLPSVANDLITGYTASYNQNLDMLFVSANQGGTYTANATTINGKSIPANSVYWNIGDLAAGKNGLVNVKLRIPNGTQSGVNYILRGEIDGQLSNQKLFGPKTILSTSLANPQVKITMDAYDFNTDPNNEDYRFFPLQDRVQIKYFITTSNPYVPGELNLGNSTIFNPITTANLSGIFYQLENVCGIVPSEITGRIIDISAGGTRSGDTLIWTDSDITINGSQQHTFVVDYTGCVTHDTVFPFSANTIANNPLLATDIEPLSLLSFLVHGELYYKIRGGTIFDEEITTMTLGMQNPGLVRLDKTLLFDKLTGGLEIISANISQTQLLGNIFYTTGGATNDIDDPPAYDYSNALGGDLGTGWTTTLIPNATWVAFYIDCIESAVFPSPVGSICHGIGSNAEAIFQLKATLSNQCTNEVMQNGMNVVTYSGSTNPNNGDEDIESLDPPITGQYPLQRLNVTPSIGSLYYSSADGPVTLVVGQEGTYTINVRNDGTVALEQVSVRINFPSLNINGVNELVSLYTVQTTQGTVDYNADHVIVDIGILPANQSKVITVKLIVPIGIQNNESFTLQAALQADTVKCGMTYKTTQITTNVQGDTDINVSMTRDIAIIGLTGSIIYDIVAENLGDTVTTNTYIVNQIPVGIHFQEAYTYGSHGKPGNEKLYTCTNCKVYFANENNNLPDNLSATNPFTIDQIQNYFTLGTNSGNGVWSSPFGTGTKYIAYLAEDNHQIFPSSPINTMEMGYKTNNFDRPIGSVISNQSAILADEMIQSISSSVQTIVAGLPGLKYDLIAIPTTIPSGYPFDAYIKGYNQEQYYYNDSDTEDTQMSFDIYFDNKVTVNNIYHTRNPVGIANGLTGNEQDITSHPSVIVYVTNTGTYVHVNIVELKNQELGGNYTIESLEGGKIRINVTTDTGLVSQTQIPIYSIGTYANSAGTFQLQEDTLVTISNPDLHLLKQSSPTDPLQSEIITYTLAISNRGGYTASGVVISDYMQSGVCYQPGSTDMITNNRTINEPTILGTCTGGGQTLIWNGLKNINYDTGYVPASYSTIYMSYQASVDTNVINGTILVNTGVISTPMEENSTRSNTGSAFVQVPMPDPYITLNTPASKRQGQSFSYNVNYGNNNKAWSTGTYIIHTLPADGSNQVNLKISSVYANIGTLYYHTGDIVGTPPAFDIDNPTDNGWSTTLPAQVSYIALTRGYLAGYAGPHTITVNAIAVNPFTNNLLNAGTILLFSGEIFSSSATPDEDITNNYATGTTRIGGIDLALQITGNYEGSYPGALPGTDMEYSITYSNDGYDQSCANRIQVTIDQDVNVASPIHDFTTLQLVDNNGNKIYATNPAGNAITGSIPISVQSLGNNIYKFRLGGNGNYTNVCLPGRSQGIFHIRGRIDDNTADSTSVVSSATIGEDIVEQIEDYMINNTDTTSLMIYRADLMIIKKGLGYVLSGASWIPGDAQRLNIGDRIKYTLQYNNIGNYSAQDAYIQDRIPEHTCFILGSMDSTLPPMSHLEYDDGSLTREYTPVGNSGTMDCTIKDVKIVFDSGLSAPANIAGESTNNYQGIMQFLTDNNGLVLDKNNFLLEITPNRNIGRLSNNIAMVEYNGEMYVGMANPSNNELYKMSSTGALSVVTTTGLSGNAYAVALKEYHGDLYIGLAYYVGGGNRLYKMSSTGVISTVTTTGLGNSTANMGIDMEIHNDELYIVIVNGVGTASGSNVLYKMSSTGAVSRVTSNLGIGNARGVAMKEFNSELYIGISYWGINHELYKLSNTGDIVLVTNTGLGGPVEKVTIDMAVYNNNLYIGIGYNAHAGIYHQLYKMSSTGALSNVGSMPSGSYGTLSTSLCEYSGYLYIMLGAGRLWRMDNNDIITFVAYAPIANASNGIDLLPYQNTLYMGLANTNTENELFSLEEIGNTGTLISAIIPQPIGKDGRSISQTEYNNNLYIGVAGYGHSNELYKMSSTGEISTVTTTGIGGNLHNGIAMAEYNSELYIGVNGYTQDNALYKMSSTGEISTVTTTGIGGGGNGRRISMVAYNGELYIGIVRTNSGNLLYKMSSTGEISTVTTTGIGGGGIDGRGISMVAYNGELYIGIANYNTDNALYKMSSTGVISTVTTTEIGGQGNVGISMTQYSGELYIGIASRYGTNQLYKMSSTGVFSTITTTAIGNYLSAKSIAIAQYDGDLYISTANYNNTDRLYKMSSTGAFSTITTTGLGGITSSDFTSMIAYKGELYIGIGRYGGSLNSLYKYSRASISYGSYTRYLSTSGGFLGRKKLLTEATIPQGTDIKMSIYSGTTYTTGSRLLGPVSIQDTGIDISSINSINTGLGVKIEFYTNDLKESPRLSTYGLSYISDQLPYLQFNVGVQTTGFSNTIIHNISNIFGSAPEITLDNNQSEYTMHVNTTDVWIHKSVNKTAVFSGNYVLYTINYGNNGPQYAENVIIQDDLGLGAQYISSTTTFGSTGGGATFQRLGIGGISTPPYYAYNVAIGLQSGDIPVIMYTDVYANYNGFIKILSGNNRINLGTSNPITQYSSEFALTFLSGNIPVIAYSDGSSSEVNVKILSGNDWGDLGLSPLGQGYDISLKVTSDNKPVIGYIDYGNKINIKILSGGDWIDMGMGDINDPISTSPGSVSFDLQPSDDTPIVVYDYAVVDVWTYFAAVKKLSGDTWVDYGSTGFFLPEYGVDNFIVDIQTDDIPIITYTYYDENRNESIKVKKLSGNTWIDVGSGVLGEGYDLSLELTADNTPLLGYIDYGNIVHIKTLNNGNRVDYGGGDISTSGTNYTSDLSIALKNDNTPVVSFTENGAIQIKALTTTLAGQYFWELGTLPAYSGGTIIITGLIASNVTLGQIISNAAEINTTTLEFILSNNTSSVSSLVGGYANVYTTINCLPTVGHINQSLNCTITYGNNGNVTATGIILTGILDTLTGYTIYGVNNPNCTVIQNTIICSGGAFNSFAAGYQGSFLVTGKVVNNTNLLTNNTILHMESIISTVSPEINLMDNYDDEYIPLVQNGDVVIQGNTYMDCLQNQQYDTGIDQLMAGMQIFWGGRDIYGYTYLPSLALYPQIHGILSGLIDQNFTSYTIAAPKLSYSNGEYFVNGLNPGTYYLYMSGAENYSGYYSVGGFVQGNKIGSGSLDDISISGNTIVGVNLGDAQQSIGNDFALQGVCGNEIIGQIADVWVQKSVDKDTVFSGDYVTYTINYGNNGPQYAENVILEDILGTGITFVSSSQPFTFSGNNRIWTIGTLPVGSGGTIIITGQIDSGVVDNQIITNTGIISTTSFESLLTNNISSDYSTVGIHCGDRSLDGDEQCDDGNINDNDGCSSICTLEANYCSGVNLYVSSTTIYSGATVTYSGTFSPGYASGYKFITLYYGRGGSRNTNSSTGASFNTGIIYHSGGAITGSIIVQNVYSGSRTGVCDFNGISIEYCGDDLTTSDEQCDSGVNNGVACTPGYNSSCSYCSNSCESITLTGDFCGDSITNGSEECDGENYCNIDCTYKTPSCSLVVSPLTGFVSLTGTFTISGIDTGWVTFDWLNFGDGSTGNINTGILNYAHLYTNTGVYTGILQVSNIYSGSLVAQCSASLQVLPYLYCGDGTIQQPNSSGNNEQCDSGVNNGVTCTPGYGSSCNYCSNSCESVTLTGDFCGDSITNGSEECDSGVNNGIACIPGYNSSCSYCSNACIPVILSGSVTPTIYCGDGTKNGSEQCDRNDPSHNGRGNIGCNQSCIPHNSNGGGSSLTVDNCTLPSTLACANASGIDLSASYYDNTCCGTTSTHSAPSLIGIGCKYTDEKYQDNGSFPDSLDSRAFQYIELLRINCIHRGQWDKTIYPYPRYDIPWKYFPERGATIAAVMKTYVKLLGVHEGTLNITREEYPYPGNTPFVDVPKTFWASRYADTAYKKGLVAGMYETKNGKLYFHPDAMATREQAAAMMMRTYSLIHPGEVDWNVTSSFTDLQKSNPYYKYIAAAQDMGFIEGFTRKDGTRYFGGKTTITRSQFAKMVALPFKDELYIDIDATILNSAIYKDIVSAIHASTVNRIVFIDALLTEMSNLDEQYIQDNFKVDKQTFLDALAVLLLDNEVNRE